jgi:hypothetical protein
MTDHTLNLTGEEVDEFFANERRPLIRLRAYQYASSARLDYRLDIPSGILDSHWGSTRKWQLYGLKFTGGGHERMKLCRFQHPRNENQVHNNWSAFADWNAEQQVMTAIDQDWLPLHETDLDLGARPASGFGMLKLNNNALRGMAKIQLKGTRITALLDPAYKVSGGTGHAYIAMPMAMGVFNTVTSRAEALARFKLVWRVDYSSDGSHITLDGATQVYFKV